jgi:hypothetical protein
VVTGPAGFSHRPSGIEDLRCGNGVDSGLERFAADLSLRSGPVILSVQVHHGRSAH